MKIPSILRISGGQTIELQEAPRDAGADDGKRHFTMNAYTGAPVETWSGPLIVDLDGLKIGRQKKPIDRDHDSGRLVGYSETIKKKDGGLWIDGQVISEMAAGQEVIAAADNDFPWQASMKFNIEHVEELQDQESRVVNGHRFTNGMVVTKSRLLGACFCAYGADENTSSVVLEETEDGLVEVESSKETDMADKKADTALSAKDVEKLKADAVTGAVEKERAELAALQEAFPDRAEFVLAQHTKGHTVEQAKAELCDVLVKDKATDTAKIAEWEKKHAELSKKADAYTSDGHQGVTTKLSAGDGPDTSKMDPEQLARHNWDNNVENCAKEFASFEVYEMYEVNEARVRELVTHTS